MRKMIAPYLIGLTAFSCSAMSTESPSDVKAIIQRGASNAIKEHIRYSEELEKKVLLENAKLSLDIFIHIKPEYCPNGKMEYDQLSEKYSNFIKTGGLVDQIISMNQSMASMVPGSKPSILAQEKASEQARFVIKSRIAVADRAFETNCLDIASEQYDKIVSQYSRKDVISYMPAITANRDIIKDRMRRR